jgi:hypothetical protein
MSLDISLRAVRETEVFEANITHNLGTMAAEAGIYRHVWRPEEINITTAGELIEPLEKAIEDMEARPDHYQQFDCFNGWGTYDDFLPWLKKYLEACRNNQDARIEACR